MNQNAYPVDILGLKEYLMTKILPFIRPGTCNIRRVQKENNETDLNAKIKRIRERLDKIDNLMKELHRLSNPSD